MARCGVPGEAGGAGEAGGEYSSGAGVEKEACWWEEGEAGYGRLLLSVELFLLLLLLFLLLLLLVLEAVSRDCKSEAVLLLIKLLVPAGFTADLGRDGERDEGEIWAGEGWVTSEFSAWLREFL